MPSAMLEKESSLRTDNLFNIDGLVAVITGGGTGKQTILRKHQSKHFLTLQGIGRMMATALAENGAHKVYVIGRREEPLNDLAAKFTG